MSEATTPEAVEKPAPKHWWDGIARVENKLSGWIDGWNPYNPEKLQGHGLKPVAIEESDIRRNAAKWFLG